MESKSPFLSKTLWINVIAIVGMFIYAGNGGTVPPEIATVVLGAINLVLRLITKKPIEW